MTLPGRACTWLAGFIFIVAALFGLTGERAAAQEPDDNPPVDEVAELAAELLAIDRRADGLIELAVTVPGVPPGEIPEVAVSTDATVERVDIVSLDAPPTVVLVIDDSGSMAGDRLAAAKVAAARCVDELPATAGIGLVAYSEGPPEIVEPTLQHDDIVTSVDALIAGGETATFDALVTATSLLSQATESIDDRASRFIVLLTDGEDTVSSIGADEATAAMSDAGFQLFALGIDPDGEFLATLETLTADEKSKLVLGGPEDLAPLCADVADRIDGRYLVSIVMEGDGAFGVQLGFGDGQANLAVAGANQNATSGDDEPDADDASNGSDGTGDDASGAGSSGEDGDTNDDGSSNREGDSSADPDPTEAGSADRNGDGSSGDNAGDDVAAAVPGGGSGNGSSNNAGALSGGEFDADPTSGSPLPEPDNVRLWAGAAALAGAPILLVLLLVPTRRIRHGLRIRRPEPTGALTSLALRVDRMLRGNRISQTIERRLEVAQIKMRAGEFVTFTALASLAVALLLTVLGLRVSAPVALVVIPAIAWFVVGRRAKARTELFQEQFGDILMVLAGSLRSGNSTMQALTTAAEKSNSPMSEELSRVVAESRIGRDVVTSLHDMADRMESEDARWVVEAIALNRELGGNLAVTLENVAETMRARAEIASQVKVMSAEGRLTARILLALPGIVATILQFINPGYLGALFTSFGGNVILGITITLMVVGAFWVSRIIKLEY